MWVLPVNRQINRTAAKLCDLFSTLITYTSCNSRDLGWAAALGALESEFNCLTRLDSAIPAHIAGWVRIATAENSIPQVCHSGSITVSPAHIPSVYAGTAWIGDTYGRSETCVPLIGNHILAFTTGSRTWWSAGAHTGRPAGRTQAGRAAWAGQTGWSARTRQWRRSTGWPAWAGNRWRSTWTRYGRGSAGTGNRRRSTGWRAWRTRHIVVGRIVIVKRQVPGKRRIPVDGDLIYRICVDVIRPASCRSGFTRR